MSAVTDSDTPPRELTDLVGTESVRPATDADSVDGIRPRFIVEPAAPSEVAQVLVAANRSGLSVIPRGGGTKLHWGNPPRAADLILSLRRLDQVLEHAWGDMTATVEAGCTIATLQQTLAKRGQRLALDPLWPDDATVGGVLATADSGPLRAAFGPPRDLVLGVTVALADGTLARSGGKVVKNVAGYDLPKLFTGSFGTLGVITQATFRLHPLPGATRDLAFTLPPGSIGRFIAAMSESALLIAGAQIRASDDAPLTACVRIESLPDAIDSKAERVVRAVIGAGGETTDVDPSEWSHREQLFDEAGTISVVCKLGLLPATISELPEFLKGKTESRWQFVMQTYGVGLMRLDAASHDDLVTAVSQLRSEIRSFGGSLAVLKCAPEVKPRIEVWGEPGDSLPLMRRVKHQFDPADTLNAGRFVGGL